MRKTSAYTRPAPSCSAPLTTASPLQVFGGALGTVSDCGLAAGCSDELFKLDAHEHQWTKFTIDQLPHPLARFGHSLVSVESPPFLFMFGGTTHLGLAKDLWSLNTVSMAWTLLDQELVSSEPRPNARERHCMVASGSNLFMFGGSMGIVPTAEMWSFDTVGRAWTHVQATTGTAPAAREGCTLATVGDKMLLFGGSTSAGLSNELWEFKAGEWTYLNAHISGRLPRPRARHSVAVVNDTMYVVGGDMGSPDTDAEVFLYHTKDAGSTLVFPNSSSTLFPPATRGHTLISLDTSIFFFGGMEASHLPEFYQINLETTTLEWSNLAEPRTTQLTPSARKHHSVVSLGNTIYLFGGMSTLSDELWSYHSNHGTWNLLSSARRGLWGPLLPGMSSASPEARKLHAMTSVGDRILLLHGGRTNTGLSNEMWHYEFEAGEWYRNPGLLGKQPSAREGHAMTAVNLTVYLFGGNTGGDSTALSADFFSYSILEGVWTNLKNVSSGIPDARQGHRLTSIAHKLYLLMGRTEFGLSADIFLYDTNSRVWRDLPSSPAARESFALAAVGTRILLHGGLLGYDPNGDALRSNELWQLDTVSLQWKFLPSLDNSAGRDGHAMSSMGTKICMFGGETASGEASIL